MIKKKIVDLKDKNLEFIQKDETIKLLSFNTLKMSLEMTARGYQFLPIDLTKSEATEFIIDREKKGLIPPFSTVNVLP